ncbi:hypothetical protein CN200_26110 [Sinorhizobium meliloti]|nr:hypothetical protein CN216_01850 [Sinorhizobium meliloti]RVI11244.1 hypothetical protein CN200_26110 [Sinorhizobium meliloti]RVN86871.1 hypothetical protein CN107_16750 [Sinorhizobium meliloti]RVO11927.1 hypothetical protein CN103_12655 [Sinorhizobium meliloti]
MRRLHRIKSTPGRLQVGRPERLDEGDIGRITASPNRDRADPQRIVARIVSVPSIVTNTSIQALESIGSTTAFALDCGIATYRHFSAGATSRRHR